MKIYYGKDGRILDIWHHDEPKKGASITISPEKLPEDFFANFALGKYRVKDGKIVTIKKYHPMPKELLDELILGFDELVQVKKSRKTPPPKSTGKKKGSDSDAPKK